jgi:pimeloyl-ACP methyl ester carboxylesterase
MPSTPTRAGEVSYDTRGTGIPIVLLHATLHSLHDFDTIIPQLSGHYQTIAIDWPWHGDSSHPPGQQPTAALFAEVLEDIVTSLNLAPAIFIGNSVGGFTAARFAITHPEHVKALVLVNTGGFVPWDWTSKFFTRLFGIPLLSRWIMPSLVPRYMSPQSTHDTEISIQVSELARTVEGSKIVASLWKSFLDSGYDLRGLAGEIKIPVLIVWGKRDPVIPLKVGHATHNALAGSRFEVLDAGHVVFASKPEEFLRLVEPFIEEVLGARATELNERPTVCSR